MATPESSGISSWHAHVYFDAATRDAAWSLRETVEREIGHRVAIGRFHEKPVGPHPMWSYQLTIAPPDFADIVAWLVLRHASLDVFIHPNTGDDLSDHRDRAVWIGRSHLLKLDVFGR